MASVTGLSVVLETWSGVTWTVELSSKMSLGQRTFRLRCRHCNETRDPGFWLARSGVSQRCLAAVKGKEQLKLQLQLSRRHPGTAVWCPVWQSGQYHAC